MHPNATFWTARWNTCVHSAGSNRKPRVLRFCILTGVDFDFARTELAIAGKELSVWIPGNLSRGCRSAGAQVRRAKECGFKVYGFKVCVTDQYDRTNLQANAVAPPPRVREAPAWKQNGSSER